MSAEKRLTIWNLQDPDETTESNIENADEVKSKMMKLIKIAKDGYGLVKLMVLLSTIVELIGFVYQLFSCCYLTVVCDIIFVLV